MVRGRHRVSLVAALACAAIAPATVEASPYVHAHRGGSLATTGGAQLPAHPEESASGYRAAARAGFVLEVDAVLTKDRFPIAFHDSTLERTTDCEGRVDSLTWAELRAQCEIDLLGTGDNNETLAPGDPRREKVPSIARILEIAYNHGVEVNLEIKNNPTEPDFDPGVPPSFAVDVAAAIKASGFPPSMLIVQSFWPANLDVIEADPYFAGAQTSLLTLTQLNEGGPAFADARGYDWVSPSWPVSPAYIAEAHSLGLQVVPYTLNDRAAIKAAAAAGVDAIITDDPGLGRKAVDAVEPPRPQIPPPPTGAECAASRANRVADPTFNLLPREGAPRVFAMQFKQELRHVVGYDDYRTKIECMVREYVKPHLANDRPNVIAFNEDVGLMTLATGSRGAAARETFSNPGTAPGCEGVGAPCGVGVALAQVSTGYGAQIGEYSSRWPDIPPVGAVFVAGTDTFGRGWMQVFSDMARRYGVYILGSNNQAPFRESVDPTEIAAFRDPDLPPPDSVYVATDRFAYNEVFMWGPEDVREEGPWPLRNVVASNRKVPLTPIEELIQLAPGPRRGPDALENLRPYRLPGTKAKIGFATSLPAFVYGHDLGDPPPPTGACADVAITYMRCLDKLGTNVVMQDEANPGRWTGPSGEGNYQPLEWMRSTWRAVADPDVAFKYNVTPHMVGNLADLVFDGQTAITQRDPDGTEINTVRSGQLAEGSCTYVGNTEAGPDDPDYLRPYLGAKTEFLAIAPWVVEDAPRTELAEVAGRLAPGSGDEIENDYVETAVVADLTFPVADSRARCKVARELERGACANRSEGTPDADRLRGTKAGDRLRGRAGDDRLRAIAGRDCVQGGGGDDRALGGPGGDKLRGGKGDDVLRGGRGGDRLVGGPGRDVLRGGSGPDVLQGRRGGPDEFHCGKGRDLVLAGPGDVIARDCERIRRT